MGFVYKTNVFYQTRLPCARNALGEFRKIIVGKTAVFSEFAGVLSVEGLFIFPKMPYKKKWWQYHRRITTIL
jgi:hypothetical protein